VGTYAQEIYDAIVEAGQEFGIRRLGGRAVYINQLEACVPTIITDYLPAIFDPELEEYLAEFRAAMPPFASTFNVAGSFDAEHVGAWYRSPVELGWANRIKFDHDFLGRGALREEVEQPRRGIRTLVWSADDVVDVYRSLFRAATRTRSWRRRPVPRTSASTSTASSSPWERAPTASCRRGRSGPMSPGPTDAPRWSAARSCS
jgi:vanillate/3-O-methylgallate O-demethylase